MHDFDKREVVFIEKRSAKMVDRNVSALVARSTHLMLVGVLQWYKHLLSLACTIATTISSLQECSRHGGHWLHCLS